MAFPSGTGLQLPGHRYGSDIFLAIGTASMRKTVREPFFRIITWHD